MRDSAEFLICFKSGLLRRKKQKFKMPAGGVWTEGRVLSSSSQHEHTDYNPQVIPYVFQASFFFLAVMINVQKLIKYFVIHKPWDV